jgi:hypothetical protein
MPDGLIPSQIQLRTFLPKNRAALAGLISHTHLRSSSNGANPEEFHFGTCKSVTIAEAKQVLIDTIQRPRDGDGGLLQSTLVTGWTCYK